MSLRHDDELPPMTSDQQAEAIRLAARLQAEHEARSTNGLLQAAAEAGIDPRFVREAASNLANAPRPTKDLIDGGNFALLSVVVSVLLYALLASGVYWRNDGGHLRQ